MRRSHRLAILRVVLLAALRLPAAAAQSPARCDVNGDRVVNQLDLRADHGRRVRPSAAVERPIPAMPTATGASRERRAESCLQRAPRRVPTLRIRRRPPTRDRTASVAHRIDGAFERCEVDRSRRSAAAVLHVAGDGERRGQRGAQLSNASAVEPDLRGRRAGRYLSPARSSATASPAKRRRMRRVDAGTQPRSRNAGPDQTASPSATRARSTAS